MNARTLIACLASCSALFFSVAAAAQEAPPTSLLRQYQRAAGRTIDTVVDDIRLTLSRGERQSLDEIDFQVNRGDWDVYGVFALRSGQRRTIEFSMGFIVALDHIDVAVVATQMLGRDQAPLVSYVEAVTDTVRGNTRRARTGEVLQALPAFNRWLEIPEPDWESLVRSDEFQSLRDVVKLHTFALLVGHEFAHHHYGHLDNAGCSIDEEIEADERGTDLANSAGYNTLLSWTPFLFFSALEGDTGIYDGSSCHPPSVCRVTYVLEQGIDDALADDEFLEYLRTTRQYDAWIDNNRRLEAFVNSGVTECPN